MSFLNMLDDITLELLTKEQFECFIEYYRENFLEDYKSDLENLEEIYKMMNGSTFVGETLRKSDQLHQTFEKSSIAMTRKLDDMIELPKSQPKRTYNEDLECEIVMVKMPKCMAWLDDEPLVKAHTPPVTHPEEVEETIGIPMEVEPLDHIKLEDLGLNTCSHDLFPSSREFPSIDEPEPQPLPNLPFLDINLGDKRGTDPPINPYSPGSFRMKVIFDEKKLGSS
ncbi:hypothetical protein Tco_1122935 [Tanacetum coccineum]|uniref:Uncharacterized protein n=1 Tax=Tanacetum coccineum TaxID=301880 RepID=A0ABQ5J3B9_9ASTR